MVHGPKVIIVAHSMGGLATRFAASMRGPAMPRKIGMVITIGTPNTGTPLAWHWQRV